MSAPGARGFYVVKYTMFRWCCVLLSKFRDEGGSCRTKGLTISRVQNGIWNSSPFMDQYNSVGTGLYRTALVYIFILPD